MDRARIGGVSGVYRTVVHMFLLCISGETVHGGHLYCCGCPFGNCDFKLCFKQFIIRKFDLCLYSRISGFDSVQGYF